MVPHRTHPGAFTQQPAPSKQLAAGGVRATKVAVNARTSQITGPSIGLCVSSLADARREKEEIRVREGARIAFAPGAYRKSKASRSSVVLPVLVRSDTTDGCW